jgi:hypothetical protein
MPEILLSILIPTVPWREHKLRELLKRLDPQVTRSDIELFVLRDNRIMTIGEKRNRLRSLARGRYMTFVDDDDMVADDYVTSILQETSLGVDVINFDVLVEGHGPTKLCRYGLTLQHADLESEYRRKPNHLMAWRREIAAAVPFPDVSYGEDALWAEEMAKRARSELPISRVLYTYRFDPDDNSKLAL